MGVHTFVICAYQKSPYLLSCIRSLKSQTENTEIICTTSTPSAWLTEIMEKQGIPLYVREGESDIQADWNFAIEKAEGEFVTIAHQDDMYGKHYVEELKKSYERWPDMTVFMTDAVTIKNGNVQRWSLKELVKKTLRLPLRFHGLADREAVKKSGLLLGNPVMCLSEKLFARSDFSFRVSLCSGLGLHGGFGKMAGPVCLCGKAPSVLSDS